MVGKSTRLEPPESFFFLIIWTALAALQFAGPFANLPSPRLPDRPRAREAGVRVGVLPVGPLNAGALPIDLTTEILRGHNAPGRSAVIQV